ncbi:MULTISPECIES: hypothetical protein [unclassified Streptomyces]|uniref:hypothetical protein n=1 Tax=unclassified Streptomyces TaxID=2593676 RepID=UPI000CD51032|nr:MULTISPECIES: hypothetical protein [unclassified Streptomyces]
MAHTSVTIPGFDVTNLSPAQLDGAACVVCAGEDGEMIPVGHVDGGQVFAHPECGKAPLHPNTLLITGPCSTPAEIADLTAVAFDVTDQLGVNTIVATSTSHFVRDYAGIVVVGPSLTSGTKGRQMDIVATVLEAEALAHRVPVIVPQATTEAASCDACGQWQTIATVRNHHGEVFCRDCRGDAPGCSWCLEDDETEPVYTGTGFAPMCAPCADVEKVRRPSPWNLSTSERIPAHA